MSRINRGITSPTQFRTPNPQSPQYVQIQPEVTQFRQLEQVLTGVQRAASAYGSYTYNKKRGEDRAKSAARQQEADDEREVNKADRRIADEATRSARAWITKNPNHSPEEFLAFANEQRKAAPNITSANQWQSIEAGAVPAVAAEKQRQMERSVDTAVNRIRSSGDSAQEQSQAIRKLAEDKWNPERADLYLAYLPTALQKEVIEERQADRDSADAAGKRMQAALADIALGLEGGTDEERARAKSAYLVDRFENGTEHEQALASGMIAPGLDEVRTAEEEKVNAEAQSELAALANLGKDPNEQFDHFKVRYKNATGPERIAVGRILVSLQGADRGQDRQNEADAKRNELVQVDLDVAEINTLKDPNDRLQAFIDFLSREDLSPEARTAILRQIPKENAQVEAEMENVWKGRMLEADTLEKMKHILDLYRDVNPVSDLAVQFAGMVQNQENLNEQQQATVESIKTLIQAHDEMRGMSPAEKITYLEEMAAGLKEMGGRDKDVLYFKDQIAQHERDAQAEEELAAASRYSGEFARIAGLPTAAERFDALSNLREDMSPEELVRYGPRIERATAEVRLVNEEAEEAVRERALQELAAAHLPRIYDQLEPDLKKRLDAVFGDNEDRKNVRALDALADHLENNDDLSPEDVTALSGEALARIEAWHRAADEEVAAEQRRLASNAMDGAADAALKTLREVGGTVTDVLANAQQTQGVFEDDWASSKSYWALVTSGIDAFYGKQDLEGKREILIGLSKFPGANAAVSTYTNTLVTKYANQLAQEDLLGLTETLRQNAYTPEGLEELRSFVSDPKKRGEYIDIAVDNFDQKIADDAFKGVKSLSSTTFREQFSRAVETKIAPLRKYVEDRKGWQNLNDAHTKGDNLNAADLKTLWDGDLYSKMLTQALDNGNPDALRALLNGNGAEESGVAAKYLNTRSRVPGPIVDLVKDLASTSDPKKLHQAALILASSRMHKDFLKDSSGSLDALAYAARIVYPPGSQGRTSSDPNAVDPIVSEIEKYKEAMKQKPEVGWPAFQEAGRLGTDALDSFNAATGNSITNQASLSRIQNNDTFRVMHSQTSGDNEAVRVTVALDRMRKAGFIPVLNYSGGLGGKDAAKDEGVYTFLYDPNSRTRVIPELQGLTNHPEEGNLLMDAIREVGATFELDNGGSLNIPWMQLEADDIEVRWRPRDFINADGDDNYPLTVTYIDQEFTYSIPKKTVDDLVAKRRMRDYTQSLEAPGWFEFSNIQYDSLYDLFSHSVGADSILPWGRNRILTPW